MPALFDVKDPRERAQAALGQASDSYSSMMPEIDPPGKTAGGALSNAIGGGMTGYMMSGMTKGAIGWPMGAGLGAGAGLLLYFLA